MRAKYISAYMVIESFIDSPIPIISVTVTSVANTPAVAAVHVHPNPFMHYLYRGINIYIVCSITNDYEGGVAKNYVMFIGDVTSVQESSNSTKTEYVINLTDNRRYIEEQPSYYLKLIRTKRAMAQEGGMHQRVGPGGETIISIYDELADANFYGVPGSIYDDDKVYYDIAKDSVVATSFMNEWYGSGIKAYWKKMTDCLREGSGWEKYYVNMNKKKRILRNHVIEDNGVFAKALSAEADKAALGAALTGAIMSAEAEAERNVTYEDAMRRFAALNYLYNTALFPHLVGQKKPELRINSWATAAYDIKSTLYNGRLLAYAGIPIDEYNKAGNKELYMGRMKAYPTTDIKPGGPMQGVDVGAQIDVYEKQDGNTMYLAAVDTTASKYYKVDQTRVTEYYLIPKLYGMIPPLCNWNTLRSGVTLNVVINEPPLTALKYNLKMEGEGVTYMAACYPGDLMVYVNKPFNVEEVLTADPKEAIYRVRGTTYKDPPRSNDPNNPLRLLEMNRGWTKKATSADHWNRPEKDSGKKGPYKSTTGGFDVASTSTDQWIPIPSYSSGEIVYLTYVDIENNSYTPSWQGGGGGLGVCCLYISSSPRKSLCGQKTTLFSLVLLPPRSHPSRSRVEMGPE